MDNCTMTSKIKPRFDCISSIKRRSTRSSNIRIQEDKPNETYSKHKERNETIYVSVCGIVRSAMDC